MQPVAFHDNAVNLSASDPCDADRAVHPFDIAAATTPAVHQTTSDLEQDHKSADDSSLIFAPNASADGHVNSLNSLEKGGPFDHFSSAQDVPMPLTKEPFLYGLRTHRHFITITILLALFTDMVTYGIIIPIMPSIIADMHGDSTLNGVLVAVYAAGIMSASPIFGILSDRMASRRVPMIIGLSGMLVATIIFMFAKVYWLLVIARFFQGISGGAVWTLGLALMTDSFAANEMGVQMGKALIGHTLGLLGGPPIGGLLHDAFGAKAPFYFCIVCAALVIFCFLILIEVRVDEVLEIRRYEAEIRERDLANGIKPEEARQISVWKLIATKRMIAAVAITALEAFDLSSLEPTLPYYLRDRFGMNEGQIGLVFIAFTTPTIISPLAGWISDRYGARYLCSSAVFICGCFMLVLSIEDKPLWAIVLTLIGIGFSTSSFIAPVLGEISAVVRQTGDKAAYARAFAIFNIAFSFGMLIGPIIAGVVYQRYGFRWNCITAACVLFLFVPMLLLWMSDRKDKMKDVAMYEREEEERKRMLYQIGLIKAERRASEAEEVDANTVVQSM